MKKYLFILISSCAAGVFMLTQSPYTALAAPPHGTSVDRDIVSDVTWTREGSPYLLKNTIYVRPGGSLTIGPGVVVGSDSADDLLELNASGGKLDILGTEDEHVTIKDLDFIYLSSTTVNIKWTDFTIAGFVHISGSPIGHTVVNIASSTFLATGTPIFTWGAEVNIQNSRLESRNGCALGTEYYQPSTTKISIGNSILVSSNNCAIWNRSGVEIDARNNWWGRPEGPVSGTSTYITGPVSYSPWLRQNPEEKIYENCCSSVLFLPGIKGSRIYKPDSILGISSNNRLWEPNRNADVTKMALDDTGNSLDRTIYTGDPILKAFGYMDVYNGFARFMDSLVKKGTIREWRPFGYDWRMSVDEIAGGTTTRATSTETLIQTVRKMAANSPTGKVTIVAHSNGGLVGKYLVKVLDERKLSDLIDSFISVAVPNLGTPQAIGSLLHGKGESILKGVVLKESTARTFAKNAGGAYGLLPSRKFYELIPGVSIAFASTTSEKINDGTYGETISTYDGQAAYMADSSRVRRDPDPADTSVPIKANPKLITVANTVHAILDNFIWPKNVMRFGILGWGLDTTRGWYYENLSSTNMKSDMGDGTVLSKSASYNVGTTTSLDLRALKNAGEDISHFNILESSSTQQVIEKVVTGNSGSFCDEVSRIKGVSCGEPDYAKEKSYVVFRTHSPVELHVYDEKGRHTGIVPPPPEAELEDDVFTFTENNIPGSDIDLSSGDTNIFLPALQSDKYTVVVKGNGVGTFDFDVAKQNTNNIESEIVYGGLPVTPLSVATTSIEIVGGASVASVVGKNATATAMILDIDGNGITDYIVNPDQTEDPVKALELLKQAILDIFGESSRTTLITRKIDRLEADMKSGKIGNVVRSAKRLEREVDRIGHRDGNLSSADKDKILALIEAYVSQLQFAQ